MEVEILRNLPNPEFHGHRKWVDIQLDSDVNFDEWLQPDVYDTSEFFNPLSLVNAPSPPTSHPLCAPESGSNISLFISTPEQGHYVTSHRRIATSTPDDCVECGESFPSEADLLRHTKLVQHQPYGCECSALFSHLDVLHLHLKYFTCDDPKYPCKFCKRYQGSDGFKRRDHLRQHIRNYHHLESIEVEKETESIRSRTERALPVCSYLSCP